MKVYKIYFYDIMNIKSVDIIDFDNIENKRIKNSLIIMDFYSKTDRDRNSKNYKCILIYMTPKKIAEFDLHEPFSDELLQLLREQALNKILN